MPQAQALATFEAYFCSEEEQAKFEFSYAKCKIGDIHTVKMADFVKAKFKYLAHFKQFGWMSYLTTQYPVHENLLRVFFSNVTLENADKHDEDLCHIVAIKTFFHGCVYPGHLESGGRDIWHAR